jgi:PIN domain
MPTTYILLDYENVQPEDLAPLEGTPYQVRVFLGSQQKKLPRELVIPLHRLGGNAKYVEVERAGKNALDFHIAYYLGRFAAEDPGSAFYVVAKDTDYDALIDHLGKQGITCSRLKSLSDLPRPSAMAGMTFDEKLALTRDLLTRMKDAKPRSLKTVRSTLSKKLGAGVPDTEIEQLVQALQSTHFIEVEKTRVRYLSDPEPARPSGPESVTAAPA